MDVVEPGAAPAGGGDHVAGDVDAVRPAHPGGEGGLEAADAAADLQAVAPGAEHLPGLEQGAMISRGVGLEQSRVAQAVGGDARLLAERHGAVEEAAALLDGRRRRQAGLADVRVVVEDDRRVLATRPMVAQQAGHLGERIERCAGPQRQQQLVDLVDPVHGEQQAGEADRRRGRAGKAVLQHRPHLVGFDPGHPPEESGGGGGGGGHGPYLMACPGAAGGMISGMLPTADLLKSWAVEAGFDRAGVARLEPSAPRGRRFCAGWRGETRRGWAGSRGGSRPGWSRPASVPGARSALCVALQYHPLDPGEGGAETDNDLWPRVARYARGRDYHDVMGERLKVLEERIAEAFPGTVSRRYVDTGPVLERELAARAGLGAVGKNTNLLHPEAGSWFLLGELFLSLDLAPDVPLADLCGSCTRCLEACPTGALAEPYRLDSNRCISYWTIEHRGALPPDGPRDGGGLGLRLRHLPGGLLRSTARRRARTIPSCGCRRRGGGSTLRVCCGFPGMSTWSASGGAR